ncbi:olfactory receptor 14a16-like [Limosa lapponica baueri]|uniref:Olfactory receptor 14a16-like n=1 Tax=Limosa lapponica baueri TaxID=1758121 RepID=A0A2I0T7L9_LIMLA|nr:olfactory receptor 14a16-like [Limosa lapponica baueri]
MSNSSSITEFFLLAFADTWELQLLHFWLFLGIYLASSSLPSPLTTASTPPFGLLASSGLLFWGCFIFIVVSCVQIFRAVLRIPSEQGQHKAFSMCLLHLPVVSLFISTGMFAHLKPPSISSQLLDLLVTVLYSVLPPAFNPLMYSMRNQHLKGAVWKLLTGWLSEAVECPCSSAYGS